ncbi:MAG TPA: iron-containing redox enzyme family protein [Polyangiaceae bacterium]|nr:iron-containing redox enzyme family protein [Polyangiaceae bacterium]
MDSEMRLKVYDQPDSKVRTLRALIQQKNQALLEHRYFRLCQAGELGREQMLEIVKQLYCFSVFFERLLTRRITEYSSRSDRHLLQMAREHLREEIGHAELFRTCLENNGISADEVSEIEPKMFTKAMFGYLVATIQHENEYVTNVAIMQVMESIGFLFFSNTLQAMDAHNLSADALVHHTEADEHHPEMGWDFVPSFDEATMSDCRRVVEDLYRLMGFTLDEWLGLSPTAAGTSSGARRVRQSTRPARRAS